MLYRKCRCGAIIPQGSYGCEACMKNYTGQSRHMEYNRHRRNKQAAAFYISGDWRRTREAVIGMYDGIDIYAYYIEQRICTADMVHHIIPVSDDWERRLDISNLIPLSNYSHGVIEALYNKDERTKKATQELLYGLLERHRSAAGGA